MTKRYIQSRTPPYKLMLIDDAPQKNLSAYVHQDSIEPFVSIATRDMPIISSKSQLKRYMAKHNLVIQSDLAGMQTPKQGGFDPSLKRELVERFNT